MNTPLAAGHLLDDEAWERVRLGTIFRCCKWDVQSEDHCVLARFPLFLAREEWNRLARWAKSLSAETLAAERELLGREDLHRRLGFHRAVRKAFRGIRNGEASAGAARVMRFDFHLTTDGWRLSEANTDVPGGFIEASGFSELMGAHYSGTAPPPNPGKIYAAAIQKAAGSSALIALIHATAYSDDGQVMEYIARELRSCGTRTCMVGPDHLRWKDGRAQIQCRFAEGAPDLLVRFFPAEWLVNLDDRLSWRGYFRGSKTPLSNPASALITQSKRFPLAWKDLSEPLPTWRALMPETRSPHEVHNLRSGEWVLKPALGRVGEGVAMPGVATPKQWEQTRKDVLRHPNDWAAQRRFEAVPLEADSGPCFACLGVFTVDGEAAGIYGRIASKPLIDMDAQDVAVLISREGQVES
ncbi:MAG TPA: glutathionylspermidine synthase family protein [Terriglobia bacterium]|nr:glutathionylspermidine synthase family protein [Terriglobia bacterium]